jgi:hypothetical protein
MGARYTRRELLRRAGIGAGAVAVTTAVPAAAAGALEGTVAGAAGGAAAAGGQKLMLARVWFTAAQQVLVGEFDDTHNIFDDGSIELLLWPGDLARLTATGLRFEITVPDLIARDAALHAAEAQQERTAALQPGETSTGQYRLPQDFEADMRKLVQRFPDKARLIELPEKTLEGRTVYAIEIASDITRRDGRAYYYFDGIHHAREWPAAEFPIMFAFDLLESYDSDAQVKRIVDNVRTIIVPVMNMDGYTHSRTALIDQSGVGGPIIGSAYWRKNRRRDSADRVDAHGVDPNRNYAYAWGDNIGGSSSSKTSETYRGVAPFSEPESQNTSWLLKTYPPTAMITHHTSGNLILWAWGDTRDDAPDNDLLEGLGRAMATFNKYRPQKSIQLYATTGTTSDYAYGVLGSIGYTFEHAGSSFHPNYANTVPPQYGINRPAFLMLAEEMCLPPELRDPNRDLPAVLNNHRYDPNALHHAILRGRLVDAAGNGVAGTVRLYKQFETLLWKDGDGNNPLRRPSVTEVIDTTIDTAADGTFVWHVNPSTRPYLTFKGETEAYELTAKANGSGVVRTLVVHRGDDIDLGDLQV